MTMAQGFFRRAVDALVAARMRQANATLRAHGYYREEQAKPR
jgi:hypothetical protein